MVPATEGRAALIVAHGSPSDPEGPEQAVRALAGSVAGLLPGWAIRGATLAGDGTLEQAVGELPGSRPVICPLFMSDGWFVSSELPRRLRKAGMVSCNMTGPVGMEPRLWRLCAEFALAETEARNLKPENTILLIAAHGSPTDTRPRKATEHAAAIIRAAGRFKSIYLGFVDERPYLSEAARVERPAICLPFFAGRAGHVEADIPAALVNARFPGPLLNPIGVHPDIARIISEMIAKHSRGIAA